MPDRAKLPAVDHFDYIIIGAGSAGCVLAERLSADGRHRVLVLEAGGSDARFWIKTPIGYGRTFADASVNWKYQTQPSAGLDGRSMYWPRGRVLGGSSSINALVYCRGMPADFDDWRAMGNVGWGWDDVRPYFEKSERRVDPTGRATGNGPLDVKDVTPFLHATRANWLGSARELGLPVTDDFNGPRPEGLGCYQVTIRDGKRHSAADAFLRPALRRGTVKVETHAWVSKICFSAGRATGVEWWRAGRQHYSAAAKEVILCGGAVNSPQLLQLSGIGPGATLSAHGIAPTVDNPAVGGHLQDHLAVVYSFKATRPTLNDELYSTLAKLRSGLRYLLARSGPLALSVNQFGGFLRADPAAGRADVQLYFNPVTYGTGDATRTRIEVDPFPGFYLCFQPTRPTSVGRIDIASGDFRRAPSIAPNYLSTDKDVRDVVHGGRLVQAIARTQAMKALILEPLAPDLCAMGDAELVADFRTRAATVYHPVGTCRMGHDSADSVVDSMLRVHGVERLRVVDASVFPTVTSANTHAPTLMVAQKAADLIISGA
ncbi:MAG TPA: GMC family oxidoreductase N-terminal domain-containing protein [Steroidobacteraceae bacterium]|nr:GMC family oxidoreductase N-terminal domain-containing protein [Steroidobacteraceae bacterium]